MPKSRHRKNHKKKLQTWKNKMSMKANTFNKEMVVMRDNLMKEMQEKQKEDNVETINVDPKTL